MRPLLLAALLAGWLMAVISRDTFTGADDTDIHGRTPDGGGIAAFAAGTWTHHPEAGAFSSTISTIGEQAVMTPGDNALAIYTLPDLSGITDEQTVRVTGESLLTVVTADEEWSYEVWYNPGGPPTIVASGTVASLGSGGTLGGVIEISNLTAHLNGQPASYTIRRVGALGPGGDGDVAFFWVCQYTSMPFGSHDWETTVTCDSSETVGMSAEVNYPGGPVDIFGFNAGDPPHDVSITDSTGGSPTFHIGHDIGLPLIGADITMTEIELSGGTGTILFPTGFNYFGAMVRMDEEDETGYGCNFDDFGFLILYEMDEGDHTILASEEVGITHGQRYTLQLCIDEADVLRVYLDGTIRITFDLHADDTEDTGNPVTAIITGGVPGFAIENDDPAFTAMAVHQVDVDAVCVEFPCTGPPENPWPNPPPPEPQPSGMWVMQNGAWRELPVPTLTDRFVHGQQAGLPRSALAARVMQRGLWRAPQVYPEVYPEPDTDEPPYFDPCEQLPPVIPPGELIPLVGRFWGMSNAPLSVCGPLFTGTRRAVGPWTPGELAQCTAKGVTIVGSPGGRSQYLLSGHWDLTTFVNATIARLSPVLSLLQAKTLTGEFFGHEIIDDFESDKLWPRPPGWVGDWNGVPHDELATALGMIRAACPDIRLGIRGRPTQFASDFGFDFYEAAYKAWMGQTATQFGVAEYGLARSRNAFCILSLNFAHGGNGSSGYQVVNGTMLSGHYAMTGAEVASYCAGMYAGALSVDGTAEWLPGTVGYQYMPVLFTAIPDLTAGQVSARNSLAALP